MVGLRAPAQRTCVTRVAHKGSSDLIAVSGVQGSKQRQPLTGSSASAYEPTWPLHMLPAAVDWRGTGADSVMKDQAMCGSCWSFAAVSPIETAYYRHFGAHLLHPEIGCSLHLKLTSLRQVVRHCASACITAPTGQPQMCVGRCAGAGIQCRAMQQLVTLALPRHKCARIAIWANLNKQHTSRCPCACALNSI